MSRLGDRKPAAAAREAAAPRSSSAPRARGPVALPPSVRAVTDGHRVAFADAAPDRRTVAHELAHVEQYRRAALTGAPPPRALFSERSDPAEREASRVADVVAMGGTPGPIVEAPSAHYSFDEPQPQSKPVRTGSFHLDPALAGCAIPANMAVHVHVAPPTRPGDQQTLAIDVALDRTVHSAERVQAFATAKEDIYNAPVVASSASRDPGELLALDLSPGAAAYTASGPISIVHVEGDTVFTAEANAETRAAAAVVFARTDAGIVIIDSGLQFDDATYAVAAGFEVGRQVAALAGGEVIGEAIATPVGRDGAALPLVAAMVPIAAVRGSLDQYEDGTVAAILEAQEEYRTWYEGELRRQIVENRATWEATQPIAPNSGVREKLWAAHLESAVAEGMKGAPMTKVANADFDGTTLANAAGDDVAAAPPPTTVAPGEVPDLADVEWVPDDKIDQLYIYGGGRLTVFSARGLVLKPATATLTPQVTVSTPALSPTGPLGLPAAAARPVTPWLMMPAVGKAGMLAVRVSGGHGILIDCGGPRVITTAAMARMSTELGGASIQKVFQSHAHGDHSIVNAVRTLGLNASDVYLSESAIKAGALGVLATTTDADLVKRGFGKGHKMGLAVKKTAADPIAETKVEAGNTEITLFARPEAHDKLLTATDPSAKEVDAASHLYMVGNESSPNKMLSLGDFRGEDIGKLVGEMGEARFKAMMKGVRVINGVGHHFGTSAGQSNADIQGLNKLLQFTQGQNGELTIMVQSNQKFAFGATAAGSTPTGAEGALLKYFQRQGVRVVFGGQAPKTSSPVKAGSQLSGAVVDSTGNVTTFGTAVQVFDGDPRVVAVHKRLDVLREAHRMLGESSKHAPAALGLGAKTAAELSTEIDADIKRLEGLAEELRTLAGKELIDARAPLAADAGAKAVSNRAALHPGGRNETQILTEMATEGPAETQLTPDVRQRLASAVASGRSIALEVEFAHVPTAMSKLIDALPVARRTALAEKYRVLSDMVSKLESHNLPPAEQLIALSHATELHAELHAARASVTGADLTVIDAEIARVNSAITQLKSTTTINETIGRDNAGRITRTKWINAANQKVMKGFHNAGRVLGAMMVIHSVEELTGDATHRAAEGPGNTPEAALRVAHAAYGTHIGLRMASTSFRQAMAGTGAKVGHWEFVAHAVLEVAVTAAGDYATTEARDAAIVSSTIQAAVNLACMAIGQKVMGAFAAAPTHPLIKAGGMGLGLLIMSAGPTVLSWLGLDDNIERWTEFQPSEVTEVNQEIGKVLSQYRVMIGAAQLAQRSDADVAAMGMGNDGEGVRKSAEVVGLGAHATVREKESELTTLFESAYARSKGSYAGLEVLDHQAAEFTRLRALAMTGREDPAREALDARWRAMDKTLDLSATDEATVRAMEQWSELDEKLDDLQGTLGEDDVDRKVALEEMGELQIMLDNARYRIDSPSRGGLRPTAMLPKDSPGYSTYVSLLQVRETRLAMLHGQLLRASGLTPDPALDDVSSDAGTTLNRLRAIRGNYDNIVRTMANGNPLLADSTTWADAAVLGRRIEDAHYADPLGFNQLQLAELTLSSAVRQLELAMTVEEPAPDAAFRSLAKLEIDGARKAMGARRHPTGLILPSEIDAVVGKHAASEDKTTAAMIDVAFPNPNGQLSQPLSEEEHAALETSLLLFQGGAHVSSTERQLASVRAAQSQMRAIEIGDKVNLDEGHRLLKHNYCTFRGSSYNVWVEHWYGDDFEARTYSGGFPLLAVSGPTDGFFEGKARHWVTPVNAAAVAALGPGRRPIKANDVRRVTEDELKEHYDEHLDPAPVPSPAPTPVPDPAPTGGTP